MINFRYHIVSLTAVFLALTVGLVMGTTFLREATVDQLKRDIKRAEGRIDRTNESNQQLKGENDRARRAEETLGEMGLDRLVAGDVADVPVLVVAADGVDPVSMDQLRRAIVAGGAEARGTVVIDASLREDGGDDDGLAEAVGADPGAARATTQRRAVEDLARSLDSAAARDSDSGAAAPAAVQRLLDGGFLRFEAPEAADGADPLGPETVLAGGGYRYLFVSGANPTTPDAEFLLPVVDRLAADGAAPVVLVSAITENEAEADRTLAVGPIRNDEALSAAVSTVDDLEHLVGVVAAVWALRDLDSTDPDRPARGHYGVGDGASAILPPPS